MDWAEDGFLRGIEGDFVRFHPAIDAIGDMKMNITRPQDLASSLIFCPAVGDCIQVYLPAFVKGFREGRNRPGRRVSGANRPDIHPLTAPGLFPNQAAARKRCIIQMWRKINPGHVPIITTKTIHLPPLLAGVII